MELDSIIRVKGLKKVYGDGVKHTVFDGADLSVGRGEFFGVFGPSGSGKSTFINIIAGLVGIEGGEVWLADERIDKLSESELALFRREHVGIVFQSYNLFPDLTSLENVLLPMELSKEERDKERAFRLLENVGLREKANNFPSQLSGGEKQRVTFARALANRPKVILADEPTGNLDEKNAERIYKLMKELKEQSGVTILVATHDLTLATKYCENSARIEDHKFVRGDPS